MIRKKRPKSMEIASVVFIHPVFAVIPANAEPLLFAADVNAYSSSLKPWGPGLRSVTFFTEPTNVDPATKHITRAGMIKM